MMEGFSEKQKKIYIGLSLLRSDLSLLYKDAIRILNSTCESAYPLAHCAREMDSILRKILASGENKQFTLTAERLGITQDRFKKAMGHIKSIFSSVTSEKKENLALKWARVAPLFVRYAHHREITDKSSVLISEFKPLWSDFEDILYELVGGFYRTVEHVVDQILVSDVLDEDKISILRSLLQNEEYEQYFWVKLNVVSWLPRLNQQIFDIRHQIHFDDNNNSSFWFPLYYLDKIAVQISKSPDGNEEYFCILFKIINDIVDFSIERQDEDKSPINRYHIWWFLVKILNSIPNNVILTQEIEFKNNEKENGVSVIRFKKWLSEFTNLSMRGDLAVNDILRLLLPKFLNDPLMYEYAGEIVTKVTCIRPSKKKRAFIKQEDAELCCSEYWLKEAFDKYGTQIGKVCHITVLEDLLDKLCCALEYHTKKQYRIFKVTGQEYYRITLNRVPIGGNNCDSITYKEGFFSGVVQKFTNKQLAGMNLSNGYDIYQADPEGEVYSFQITSAADGKSFKNVVNNALCSNELQKLKLDKSDEFERNITFLYESFFEDYSYIWYRSLEEPEECHGDGAHDVLSILIKDIFLGKCASSEDDGNKLITKIIESERYKFPLFGRYVLLVINKYWENYHEQFQKVLAAYPKLLEQSDYQVELYDLFKSHASDFTEVVIAELKKRIDNPPEWYKLQSRDKQDEKYLFYWQYERLSMLKSIEPFKSDYLKLKENFKDTQEPSIERKAMRGGFVSHTSPISKEEILQKPVAEIVSFLGNFKGAGDLWEVMDGKPDKEGLSEVFREAVKDRPDYFVHDITLFKDLSFRYTTMLLRGLQEAWKANKLFDWNKIFLFCKEYIIAHKDSKEEKEDRFDFERTCEGLSEEVARLIEAGSADDKNAFDNTLIASANELFEVIFSQIKFAKRERQKERGMNYALNTSLGRVIYSYFIFSLHVKKTASTHELLIDWGKQRFDRFFKDIDEGFIYFGRFLPNMCFLDKEWAHKKVIEINGYSIEDQRWKDFFESYLSGTSVYKDIYDLLKLSYEKAIKSKLFDDEVDSNLAQHIALAYLRDYESLDKNFDEAKTPQSMFELMLHDANTIDKRHRWNEVVSFMWSCTGKHNTSDESNKVSPAIVDKILRFWNWTYVKRAFVKKQLGEENYSSFLSELCLLTLILPYVSDGKGKHETKSWLLECVPHIEKMYYSGFFIEYLLKFNDEDSLKNIAEIYKKLLKYSTPTYKKEDIEELMRRISKVDPKSFEEIIDTYGQRNQHFLRDVLNQYNEEKSRNR